MSTLTEVSGISSSDLEKNGEQEPKQRKKAKGVMKPVRVGFSLSVHHTLHSCSLFLQCMKVARKGNLNMSRIAVTASGV